MSHQLLPVDEAPSRPDFFNFRKQVFESIEKRDLNGFKKWVSPEVWVGTGPESQGWEALSRRFQIEDKNAQPLWNALVPLTKLGGRFVQANRFCGPYVFTDWPTQMDGAQYAAVIGDSVNIRKQASSSSPVVRQASYHIVRVPFGEWFEKWVRIETPSGRSGYIAGQYLRNPYDYRFCFEKNNGHWTLTHLIAGKPDSKSQ